MENKSKNKKIGFSPLLSIAIVIVVAVLIVMIWLIYYNVSMPSEINQTVIPKSTAPSDNLPEKLFSIDGTIGKLTNDQVDVIVSSPLRQSTTSKIRTQDQGILKNQLNVKILPQTKYYRMILPAPGKQQAPAQEAIDIEQLKLDDKIIIYTKEDTRTSTSLTAREILVLP